MSDTLAADDIASAVVARAASGDVAALEQIVARYHDEMTRVCVVVCGGDADLAQDAVQSAWPIAWRKLGTLRDSGRLRAWLVTVAANEARQILRQRRRRVVVELDLADIESSQDDPADAIRSVDLRAAVRRLDPEDRTLLALRYVAGFDSSELGLAMGMSSSGVRSRLERLTARLRRELDHD
ncbi:MAG TPA: sigma-70 family RNA polymerase sigma factor [Candidatus Limnocylindrales bacterium]|nr:sigma-70 family RNA polymerase sigma factor [Candidatus Limnocylindrales bacterium]